MKTGSSISGFTIVELTVIIVIAGILAVSVAPRLNLQGYDDTRAVVELIQGIRYAQFQSLYRTDNPGFYITIASDSFTLRAPGGAILADPANPGPYTRTFAAGTFGDTGRITFDGRGQPTCSDGLACDVADETISVAGSTITLERFTGYVH